MFADLTKEMVIKTGIVVCQQSSWIAVSPDGVIFENGIPTELLEIKCPYKGASMPIDEAIEQEFRKCLDFSNNGIALKKSIGIMGRFN